MKVVTDQLVSDSTKFDRVSTVLRARGLRIRKQQQVRYAPHKQAHEIIRRAQLTYVVQDYANRIVAEFATLEDAARAYGVDLRMIACIDGSTERVVNAVVNAGPVSASEVVRITGLSDVAVYIAFARLVKVGVLRRCDERRLTGPDSRGRPKRVWFYEAVK